MSRWRLIEDDGARAADGLALDEALLQGFHRGGEDAHSPRPVLRLYTYRSHCALVGRHQGLSAEVDLAACDDLGVEVGRRPTGGGAIIMGEGQLGVAVATRAPVGRSPRDILRSCAEGVIDGLGRLGIDAGFRGRNDIEAGGRKIAGLGLHLDQRGGLLFHASVLADLDADLLVRVLRIPGAKLSAHGISRVEERVTTVSREIGTAVLAADIRPFIAAGIAESAGADLEPAEPTAAEREAAAGHAERHRSPEWLDRHGGRTDAHASALVRTADGMLRVYVGVQSTALSSVMVTGDVSVLPASISRAEAALRWLPAEPDVIADALAETVEPDVLGVGPQPIADAVWSAAREAMERSGSLPVRLSGSCYFPDPDPDAAQPAAGLVTTEGA